MCECYVEPCKICGQKWPMHLGDYETSIWEIAIVCGAHISEKYRYRIPWKYVIWKITKDELSMNKNFGGLEGKEVAVVSLTDNAWARREANHPNTEGCKIVKEVLGE
jgi:hypothetical protein